MSRTKIRVGALTGSFKVGRNLVLLFYDNFKDLFLPTKFSHNTIAQTDSMSCIKKKKKGKKKVGIDQKQSFVMDGAREIVKYSMNLFSVFVA